MRAGGSDRVERLPAMKDAFIREAAVATNSDPS
jgi:hypothetical protein